MISMPTLIGVSIALATLAGLWRGWRREQRIGSRLSWAAVQLLASLVFWFVLYPPERAWREEALTVIAPDKNDTGAALPSGQGIVALPGADAPARIERVPDLATALRRHPLVRELDIVGNGLPLRDQAAAAALPLRLHAPVEPAGLTDLRWTQRAAAGQQWFVHGSATVKDATVELRDPSGELVDSSALDADGGFTLSAPARIAGLARLELRLLDARKQRIDSASIPLEIEDGVALSAIVQAGAPSPELKYWRRWASDAGVRLDMRIALSDRLGMGDEGAALDAAALAKADFAVFDERSWLALDSSQKATLLSAVDQGLGLLLRVSSMPDASVLADWSAFGFVFAPGEAAASISLDRALLQREHLDFNATPLSIAAGSATPLLTDDRDHIIVAATSRGQGRIAVSMLLDSFQLVLRGDAGRYGSLWGRLISEIARPQQRQANRTPIAVGWIGERQLLCDLGDTAQVIAASGEETRLIVSERCAGYWPKQAGWHRLVDGEVHEAFYVRDNDDAESLRHHRDRVATQALVSAHEPAANSARETGRKPIDRWPLLLLWLIPTALLWWRERRQFAG